MKTKKRFSSFPPKRHRILPPSSKVAQTWRFALLTYGPSLLWFEECFVLSLPQNKSQGGLALPLPGTPIHQEQGLP